MEGVLFYPVLVTEREIAAAPAAAASGDADAEDVASFRAGDESAFEALVARREREVYRIARRILVDPDDALDAAQESFVRAYRGLRGFRGDATFRTWLIGVAINVCRNKLASAEHAARRRTVSLEPERDGQPVAAHMRDPAPDPEACVRGGELRAALEHALAELMPEQREVIVLREIEGLEYGEIAHALGCPIGTVRSRLARGRAALREKLEGVWP